MTRIDPGCLVCLLSLLMQGFVRKASAQNCTGVVCNNGGVCNSFAPNPPCICPLPYIPPYCSAAANYCNTLQPEKGITALPVCQNGGNCTMAYSDPYFNCTCQSGFTGLRCNETSTTTATIYVPDGSWSAAYSAMVIGLSAGIPTVVIVAAIATCVVLGVKAKKKNRRQEAEAGDQDCRHQDTHSSTLTVATDELHPASHSPGGDKPGENGPNSTLQTPGDAARQPTASYGKTEAAPPAKSAEPPAVSASSTDIYAQVNPETRSDRGNHAVPANYSHDL